MSEKRFLKVPISIWDGLSGLAGLIGIGALAIGGTFATLEYRDRLATARAAETIALIEIWEVRGAQEAFQQISRVLEQEVLDASVTEPLTNDEQRTVRENIARRVILQVGSETYQTVVRFFTRMALCIQAELCSKEVAEIFFSETVIDFRVWFASEVEARRKLDSGHAKELDWLACTFLSGDQNALPPKLLNCDVVGLERLSP